MLALIAMLLSVYRLTCEDLRSAERAVPQEKSMATGANEATAAYRWASHSR